MEPGIPSSFGNHLSQFLRLAAVALCGGLLATGCRQEKTAAPPSVPPVPGNVVAVVGSEVITAESFQNELARRIRSGLGKFPEPKEKQALLEEMIRLEVLHQKALAAGYDRDPQILANLRGMIVAKFQEDQMAKASPSPVTAEEIADFYQRNPQRFGTPARVRAAVIEFTVPRTASAGKRAEVAARAEAVLAEAMTNASPDHTFGLVAQRHSEHQSSRYRGGDIGWLTAGATNSQWAPAVLEAVFKLSQPGETSQVIESSTAFYLIRIVEKQPARMRPLEEVKDGVAYLITRQKEQQREEELHAAMKQGLNIQINQTLLDSIAVPVRETKPPGMPGGLTAQARSTPGR